MASLLAILSGAADAGGLSGEARTSAYLDCVKGSPPRLRMLLAAMPKGADLHNHAGGSIYAEDFLRWAATDGLCIATDTNRVVDPPCDAPDRVPAKGLELDYDRYSHVIDALSTRGFEAGMGNPTVSGYDRFFATFNAFGPVSRRNIAKSLAATREAAANDRVSYIEHIIGPPPGLELALALKAAAPPETRDPATLWRIVQPLLPAAVARARSDFDGFEADAARIDGCAGPEPVPACKVDVRYLATTIRNAPPAQVFGQLAFSFALAGADPRFVGINIAAPEHHPIAVRDYALHMRMLAFLKARYPKVPLTLHAGELTLGQVPARDLRFHIREAVEVAGARRIGHGVDIAYEADAATLLARMARDRIAVEINLSSNAIILGVKGRDHPLSLYRAAGVPVVLSTDDEGVERTDMTNEYVRAVTEQGLRYTDLKQIVRDGLQYSFLPGLSLWADRAGGPKVLPCAVMTSPACAAFVAANPKAARQRRLERDLAAFEQTPREM